MPEPAGVDTPESAWLAWAGFAGIPSLALDPDRRVVVVAPHPDDETLALGGLLYGHGNCVLVAVTEGEGSHPDSVAHRPTDLARLRANERSEALRRLRRESMPIRVLHQPDGGIDEGELVAELEAVARPGDVVLATWQGDGHPDHEAVGRAAAAAAAATGATLWEYPVWTWAWAHPADPRVPWARARALRLGEAASAAKARAISAYRSQISPLGPDVGDRTVLSAQMLAHFDRDREIVFIGESE